MSLERNIENTITWKQCWSSPLHRLQIIVGSVLVATILGIFPFFFNTIQKRDGTVLNDWLLSHLPVQDCSLAIFAIIWGIGSLVVIRSVKDPMIFVTYAYTFIFVCIMRMFTISIFALNPPIGLVQLKDPLTGIFYGQSIITKDLFFSGHTSNVFLAFLCFRKKGDRIITLFLLVVLMVMLLLQHVHYTIDVIAAPVMVFIIFQLTVLLIQSFKFEGSTSYLQKSAPILKLLKL